MDTNINVEESYYEDIFYRLYTPKNEKPIASMLIIHGMQEHSGRYEELALYFAEKGYIVLSYDHLGHGKTVKQKEDFGYFEKENPANALINKAKVMTDYLNNKAENIPHFVLAHSMGSFILRSYLQDSYKEYQAVVLVGSGGKNNLAKPAKLYLKLMNRIAPRKRNAFLNTSFHKVNNRKFKNDAFNNGTNWLSLSISNQKSFINDSLTGIPFTYNGLYGLLSVIVEGTQKNWATKIPKDFPILFVSGADDPIGDFGKGIKKTVNNLEEHNFNNVSYKLYEHMRHEILNEEIKEEVFDDIYNWLEKFRN